MSSDICDFFPRHFLMFLFVPMPVFHESTKRGYTAVHCIP